MNEASTADIIPPEIWSRVIFWHLKAHVDYRLEYLFVYVKDSTEFLQEFRRRKEIIDSLKFVSHKWEIATIPFAYEYVIRSNELTSGWYTLLSNLLEPVMNKTPCVYVKQLHLFAKDGHMQRTSASLSLISAMPLIEVLSIGFEFSRFDVFNSFIDSVLPYTKNLRRLNWFSPIGSTTRSIETILINTTKLQWLTISTEEVYQFQAHDHVRLESLRTLVIYSKSNTDTDIIPFIRWELPALSRLRITHIGRPPSEDVLFFAKFGSNLAELDFTSAISNSQPILDLCTSLTTLVFGVQTNPLEFIRHNLIRVVRIKGLRIKGIDHNLVASRIHSHLARLTIPTNLPFLTQIQILDFVPTNFYILKYSVPVQDQWRHWVRTLRDLHISFVDFYGDPIQL